MILRAVRAYLDEHRQATLGDIAIHFGRDAEVTRSMVDVWVRKGVVRELDVRATCNMTCPLACSDAAMTVYRWVGDADGRGRC